MRRLPTVPVNLAPRFRVEVYSLSYFYPLVKVGGAGVRIRDKGDNINRTQSVLQAPAAWTDAWSGPSLSHGLRRSSGSLAMFTAIRRGVARHQPRRRSPTGGLFRKKTCQRFSFREKRRAPPRRRPVNPERGRDWLCGFRPLQKVARSGTGARTVVG
jgi:hypothetical protein